MPPGHPYRDGTRGRSIRGGTGQAGTHFAALLQCSCCTAVGEVGLRAVIPPEQIDKKFKQRGWRLDPHICPDHAAKRPEKPIMAATPAPSPAAIQAQAKMFNLLNDTFDADKGVFAHDWTDQRIADTTNLAVETVVAFREAAFGPLKEPPEFAQIRADIAALEELWTEQAAAFQREVTGMKSRLADVSKRWAL